jgi:hypothetical protein
MASGGRRAVQREPSPMDDASAQATILSATMIDDVTLAGAASAATPRGRSARDAAEEDLARRGVREPVALDHGRLQEVILEDLDGKPT